MRTASATLRLLLIACKSLAKMRGDLAAVEKLEVKLFAESGITNRGSRISPRHHLYFRGYLALKKGRAEEAIETFRKALSHSPATWDIDPFEDCLANAYLELGRFDEAIAETERVLRLNPNYPLARFHLARAFERKGMSEKAAENYQLFLQIWNQADEDIPEIIAARNFIGKANF